MSRLVVFGCSNTEGQGLINPKEEVWGALLAQHLGRDLVNNAKQGASNKYIAHSINEFAFKPDDLAIIAWSYLNRSCVLRKSLRVKNEVVGTNLRVKNEVVGTNLRVKNEVVGTNLSATGASTGFEESVCYFKYFYDDYDSNFTNGVFMDFSIDLLLSKEIEFKQIFNNPSETPNLRHKNTNTFPFVFRDFFDNYPRAADNAHMGPEGNEVLASFIYKKINGKYLQ